MEFKAVLFEKDGAVARVRLNRPEALNAYNLQMRDDLSQVFSIVRDDPEIRAMIVSGVGRAYCAGADLTEFGTAPSPIIARDVRWQRDLWGVLRTLDKFTLVAMHGFAFGSGIELAMLCDMRIAAEGTKMGLPEATLGMIPAAGATQSLPRVVGMGTALDLILTCRRIDAAEALSLGLVNRVVPVDALLETADEIVARVLAAPQTAVSAAKRAIIEGMDLPLIGGLRLERRMAQMAAYGN